MGELSKLETRTPIEIALDIDSDGMTTARKLYAFLELRKEDFSRWCKTNITENEFATENEDYMRRRLLVVKFREQTTNLLHTLPRNYL